jgi:hypothetical protein
MVKMLNSTGRRGVRARLLSGTAALAVVATSALVPVAIVVAAPAASGQTCGNQVNVAPRISPDRTTIGSTETATVTVTGSSYLLPNHVCGTDVFGGVYLFFGWVKPGGQWGPSWRSSTSATGLFGQTYSYPGEGGGAETRDDGTGVVRLISFTEGGESGTATDFHMDAAGNWQSSLVVRGSTYTFKDIATGNTQSVDCLQVQCGVFTIGAHGKASRTNEQFSPINFTTGGGAVVVPPAAAPDAAPGGASGGGGAAVITGGAGAKSNTPTTTAPKRSTGTTPTTAAGVADDGSTTTAPAGSIGEAPTETTEPAVVAGETTVREADDGTQSASARVQDFGGDDSGSGGSGALIGGGVAAVVVIAGTGAFLARRKKNAVNTPGVN